MKTAHQKNLSRGEMNQYSLGAKMLAQNTAV